MNSQIYQPAEDSYFLSKFVFNIVKTNPSLKILDMGSGSGIQAETAIKAGGKNITAIDINYNSIKLLKNKNIDAIQSNLFQSIKKEDKFDLIIFNPPYLPKDKYNFDNKIDTTGGEKGDEIILEFLKKAKNYLNKNGTVLLLISSLTSRKKIDLEMKNYFIKKLASTNLFFEKLEIYELLNK